MNAKILCTTVLIMAACLGCGRKLPPLPPAPQDPVVIKSLQYKDEKVTLKAECLTEGAKLVLLGKPQGICPNCTEDIKPRQEAISPGGISELTDEHPEERCMVYRVKFQKGTTTFLSPAQIVCK